MNIVVCVKQVPDTATRIADRIREGRIDLEGVEWVANPYDEYAVEAALRLKETYGGTVYLVTIGPERAQKALKDMLALGADEAIHIQDPVFENAGRYAIAQALAAAIRKIGDVDLVWTGYRGVDEDHGLVTAFLAEELGWPHLSFVVQVEPDPDAQQVRVKRDVEGGHELLETSLPAVLSAQEGLNPVRYASLKGIMAANRKTIPVWTAADLGLDAAAIAPPEFEFVDIEPVPPRPPGRVLDGPPEEAIRDLVRLLHEEAKVI